MEWFHRELRLPAFARGFHLITESILKTMPEIQVIETGILHVFLTHTSASLTVNENADPDVRRDLARVLDRIAPEDFPFQHTAEGKDDMPAHVKASLLGTSVSIPVHQGKLCLGTWQGIYLGEHRDDGGNRRLVLTLSGKNR